MFNGLNLGLTYTALPELKKQKIRLNTNAKAGGRELPAAGLFYCAAEVAVINSNTH
jgi:hypothetical protein